MNKKDKKKNSKGFPAKKPSNNSGEVSHTEWLRMNLEVLGEDNSQSYDLNMDDVEDPIINFEDEDGEDPKELDFNH